jgi:hypothetical protein
VARAPRAVSLHQTLAGSTTHRFHQGQMSSGPDATQSQHAAAPAMSALARRTSGSRGSIGRISGKTRSRRTFDLSMRMRSTALSSSEAHRRQGARLHRGSKLVGSKLVVLDAGGVQVGCTAVHFRSRMRVNRPTVMIRNANGRSPRTAVGRFCPERPVRVDPEEPLCHEASSAAIGSSASSWSACKMPLRVAVASS